MCMMPSVAKACFGVYVSHGNSRDEPSSEFGEIRAKSWEAILKVQHPTIKHSKTLIWSIIMLCVMFSATVWSIVLSFKLSAPFDILSVAIINGLLSVLWLFLFIWNRKRGKPTEDHPVKRNKAWFSYFFIEQLQQVIAELSLYPILCLSAAHLSFTETLSSESFVFVLCLGSLLVVAVFAARLYTLWKHMRDYTKNYFKRLCFAIFFNYLSVLFLLVLILCTSPKRDLTLQILLSTLVFTTNIWNLFMFYLSHLYEITLQSAVNADRLKACEIDHAKRLIQELKSQEVFHKNMYAMSMPGYAILLYFWIVPSTVVTVFAVIEYMDQLPILIPVVVWYFFNAVINFKTLLLSCAAHFTLAVIFLCSILTVSLLASAICVCIIPFICCYATIHRRCSRHKLIDMRQYRS